MNQYFDTVVIGAGISGLTYAYHRRDDDVVVVDGARRVGGLVRTVKVDGEVPLRYEWGPETVSDSTGAATKLCNELGIELRRTPADASKRFILCRGKALAVSPAKLLTSSLLPPHAALRAMTEPWRRQGVALDGSIADFFRHRLGARVLDSLVDPMISGIYAGDPELLSFRACFPTLAQGVEESGTILGYFRSLKKKAQERTGPKPDKKPWKPAGGMSELPLALGRALTERLRLETNVQALEERDGRWVVGTSAGELHAQHVVLALPVRATARLLEGAAPAAAGLLANMHTENLAGVIHAYRREDVAHPLDGFGYLVPSKENVRHLGTLFSSSLDPECVPEGVVLLRTLLGGARHPEEYTTDAAELLDLMKREVAPILGIGAEPLWSEVVRHEGALPRYDLKHPTRLAQLAKSLPPNLSILGNHQRGIGLSALIDAGGTLAREHAGETVAASL